MEAVERTQAAGNAVPIELVRKWNWGAFLLGGLWPFWHGAPWLGVASIACGLLSPLTLPALACLGLCLYLGINGNAIAVRNRAFASTQEFVAVERAWSRAGFAILIALGLLFALALAFAVYFSLTRPSHPSGVAAGAVDAATANAYRTLVAAEDDRFAGVRGKRLSDTAEATFYQPSVTLAGWRCVVTISKIDRDKNNVVCLTASPRRAEADRFFDAATQAAALAGLTPNGQSAGSAYINVYDASDGKHSVLILEKKVDAGYRVQVTFANPAFY